MPRSHPTWDTKVKYRVRHKWQHLIDAQEAGKVVQYRPCMTDPWADGSWDFNDTTKGEYRLKPEPKKIKARMYWYAIFGGKNLMLSLHSSAIGQDPANHPHFRGWAGDWQEVEVPS